MYIVCILVQHAMVFLPTLLNSREMDWPQGREAVVPSPLFLFFPDPNKWPYVESTCVFWCVNLGQGLSEYPMPWTHCSRGNTTWCQRSACFLWWTGSRNISSQTNSSLCRISFYLRKDPREQCGPSPYIQYSLTAQQAYYWYVEWHECACFNCPIAPAYTPLFQMLVCVCKRCMSSLPAATCIQMGKT